MSLHRPLDDLDSKGGGGAARCFQGFFEPGFELLEFGRDGGIAGEQRPAFAVHRAGLHMRVQGRRQRGSDGFQAVDRFAQAPAQIGQGRAPTQGFGQRKGIRHRRHKLSVHRESVSMQVLIMNNSLGASRVLQFSRVQLTLAVVGVLLLITLLSGTVYHFIFLKAAREGWPVVSQVVQLIGRDEVAQRDRYLRENLDAMARKLGEMQARMVQLEAISERVSGLAGIKPQDLKQLLKAAPEGSGKGGPFIPATPGGTSMSMEVLDGLVAELGVQADQRTDLFTLIESRLFEKRLAALMVPNSRPVDGPVGSGFGFRSDPFSGRAALHTGLDFPSDIGTPIHAAAGGVVLQVEFHPQYGHMVELDHGRGLVTRYAHTSKVLVKVGDLIKRGQVIAQVGTTGRSTGPHLHFEVLVDGVPQDPARFLATAEQPALATTAALPAK